MNRTDRLLAIVLELQAKRRQRAEDLAATFEISKRTVYRDIQALCEAGVPVVAAPGQGYSLVEGYFLPPLRFTSDEAMMLLLGSDVMAQNFDAAYRLAAQSAERKIRAVVPERLREQVDALREQIRFIIPPTALQTATVAVLADLRRAINERRTVRFRYTARFGADDTTGPPIREADPYALVQVSGVWHLVAYCHLRQDRRNFRLERMQQLTLLTRTFEPPEQLELEQSSIDPARSVVVRVLFSPAVARWVREARSFFVVGEEERTDGLLLTLHVRQEREVLQWVLGWGASAQVLEPATLRQMVVDEVKRLQQLYVDPERHTGLAM
ncbi:MAG: YafY family transcriptional regulator [Herpetosiphonaceae bacterium]|nr:YafY family transcriptional regulator [Herpetosiphonaceae bacterium]